uniref:Uncharacterized protein n=1 Tax=Clytia hemisphaerica TaxID=252671 RepID=A0A7M5WZM2_9CNID
MASLRISNYCTKKHSAQVQTLLDRYLTPMYCQRLKIPLKDKLKYTDIEDCLESDSASNPKFEGQSHVAIEKSSGKLVACQLNYYVSKETFKNVFIDSNQSIAGDLSNNENIRKYCQHRYAVCHDLIDLYEKYNLEKILYMETTVILPEYRRLRVPDLLQDPVYGNYPNDGILAEGMLTVGSYLAGGLEQNKLIQSVRRGEMIYCKRVLSHDGFVVPVVFRPPLC